MARRTAAYAQLPGWATAFLTGSLLAAFGTRCQSRAQGRDRPGGFNAGFAESPSDTPNGVSVRMPDSVAIVGSLRSSISRKCFCAMIDKEEYLQKKLRPKRYQATAWGMQ